MLPEIYERFPPPLVALQILAILTLVYTIVLVINRLYFSPLSSVPGPKLAAATSLYEFYYNVVKGGKFFLKIQELHEEYGPIVRLGPNEVHISDPTFYSTIYSLTDKRNKAARLYRNAFWGRTSSFSTLDHDLHRLRRGMVNQFFSMAKIRTFAPWIQERVDLLCERFNSEFRIESEPASTASSEGDRNPDKIVNLTDAFSCLTADTIMEYSFAEHYDLCAKKDFKSDLIKILVVFFGQIHVVINFPFLLHLQMAILPRWFVLLLDPINDVIFSYMDNILSQIIGTISGTSQSHQDVSHSTIFADILSTKKVPPKEKSKERLFDESQVVVSAGLETTGNALAVTMFYILEDGEVLRRLKEEMDGVWSELAEGETPNLLRLEGCAYLTAVIFEALRLSYGPIARLPRIAPNQTLTYTNPHTNTTYPLPPGTVMSTSTYTMNQNPVLFPNPQAFLPSRWLPDPVTGEAPRAPSLPMPSTSSTKGGMKGSEKLSNYLATFGKGSRSCPGMNLAWAEMYITLANVIRKCDMELWETGRENVVPDKEYFLSRPKVEGGVRVRIL
ncbi:hypothetical protein ONS95_005389 [Cadophora gregata]|uniref:uncharacterized protein n=1 Tax=Cadophora gregata TaxID=51156 RepID=UPI0026DB915A|nr:uncharacterized protein ONS95_005389 [Cadophora gregata]KAK0103363.1 hypothetical protein ONS95_005389 [Cadophora gregata]KAK0107554.1 hypothetical protein ONS96_003360 [Cadophora gregata f. sp. sojae]